MPWEERANPNCKNTPIELWFGTETPLGGRGSGRTVSQTRAAKAICAVCPVLEECRAWALESRVPFGILGGMTERERWEAIEGKPVERGTRLIRPLG